MKRRRKKRKRIKWAHLQPPPVWLRSYRLQNLREQLNRDSFAAMARFGREQRAFERFERSVCATLEACAMAGWLPVGAPQSEREHELYTAAAQPALRLNTHRTRPSP